VLRLRAINKTAMILEDCRTGDFIQGLLDLISDLPKNITMAEIGCFKGESTLLFINSNKVDLLYAIDVWKGEKFELAEKEFDIRLVTKNIIKYKMTSSEAIGLLPKLDFVYIDGDHSYEWVKRDILNSLKVLKLNGIIAGHDYSSAYKDKVVRAVNEVLGLPDKTYKDTSWLKFIQNS
jgi:predicted O-methyltransferase YrrM